MTIKEILAQVNAHKRMSRETLYVKLRIHKIEPIGERQCPQIYPDDTPQRILIPLGLLKPKTNGKRPRSRTSSRSMRPRNLKSRRRA